MVLKVLLFLAAILALTIGAHLLLYRAVTRLFMINNSGLRISLLVILLLLSLSFMASFFLLQWQENSITIGFYKFSACWTALFVNFLMAALLSWIIAAAIWLAATVPNTRLIAAACFSLAIVFTGYGSWNAFHLRTKELSIEFENLPDHWRGKTIIQLSDVHLGHFYDETFLNHLVRSVNALNPELIFITGDLFDGMAKNISHFAAGLNQLKAREGVYFVTGNHETYIGVHRALNVLKKTHVIILKNEVIDLNGLQVIGIGYPGIKEVGEIKGLEKLRQNSNVNGPRILLFHTPTNIIPRQRDGANQHFSTYWIPDTTYSTAQNLGVDLQLSGHTHAGQLIPFGSLTKRIYKGFENGLRRLSSFSIYTTSGVGSWGPPMRTGNSPEIVVIRLKQKN